MTTTAVDKMRKQKYLLILLLCLVISDVAGLYVLTRHSALFRVTRVSDINSPSLGTQNTRLSEQEKASLLSDMKKAGLDRLRGEEQVLAVMTRVMNQCSKVEAYVGCPYEALQYARRGGGLTCQPMADVFKESLGVMGVKAGWSCLFEA